MITVRSDGVSLYRQLDALKLPPGKKKRINQALARKVGVYARKHIREQRDIFGKTFVERAEVDPEYDTGKHRGKMLRNIAKTKHMKAMGDPDKGKVYFQNPLIGSTAKQQQDGWMIPERSRRKRDREGADGWGEDPATRRQAQRLLSLGFKIRKGKRGYIRPPLKWIGQNMTINHAGLIIRILEGEEREERKRKSGRLPARAFLGVTDQEEREMSQLLVDMLIKNKGY